MSKEIYAIIFLLSDALCFGSLLWLRKYEHRLKRIILELLGVSCLTISLYLIMLISNNYSVMKAAYCMYFVSMDWICVALFYFTIQFTAMNYRPIWKKIIIPILVVDSCSIFMNIWFDHVLKFQKIIRGKELFLIFKPKIPFMLHLGICYICIIGVFVILCVKIISEPRIKKVQYTILFTILLLIVLVNAVFLFTNLGLDISIIAYGIGAVAISYYTVLFLPKYLISKMSGIVLNSFQSAIVLFDEQGDIIYENEETNNWEGEKGTDKASIFKVLNLPEQNELQAFQVERAYIFADAKRMINIKYSPLTETNRKGKQQFIGSFLVMDDVSEQIRRVEEREYNMSHDELTGLYNRSYFCENVPIMMMHHPDIEYSIVMTDLYQFKLYNEAFGFEAGNGLIKTMANIIADSVKNTSSICARYNADRFVICLPTDLCTPENFVKYHEKNLCGIEDYQVAVYMGIYPIKKDNNLSIPVICERATIALNTVKGDSTQHYAWYDNSMRDALYRGKYIIDTFENALESGEIKIYIQPQVDQKTDEIVGGEVLARWITSDGKFISPGEFIPVLEQHGIVTRLDRFIWEEAVKLAKQMEEDGYPVALSVNISTQDLYRCDIYKVFTGLCEQYELSPEYIKMELTESNVIRDLETQVTMIKRLQAYGFKIEMDDFGSGYSSLNSLKDIPVDVLKMDLRFLESAENEEKSRRIIRTIILLGEMLGIPIIAEGVESNEQLVVLNDQGCRFIQGYLFGKPMPVDEFVTYRKEREYRDICS